ncbi:MAG: hypothetical protein AAGI11_22430 [Pseudomonadota bacterium]
MPIPSLTAELVVSITRGVIKLGSRLDEVAAESIARNGDIAIPDFEFSHRPTHAELLVALENLVNDPDLQAQEPDPLGEDRQEIHRLLSIRDSDNPTIGENETIAVVQRLLPDLLTGAVIPDSQRVERELHRLAGHANLDDQDIRRAVYFLGPGRIDLGDSLGFRLAMVVVDVLAEFTLENQHLLVKDDTSKEVLAAILTRFASGDLEDEIASSEILLRRLLSSTMNGALDARESWSGSDVWLTAALDALDDARTRSAGNGAPSIDDDYLVGLLRGQGYRRLVSELLEEGGEVLAEQNAGKFGVVLADVLIETAPLVRSSQDGFESFFQAHWSDLTRAALHSVSRHGNLLLDNSNPIVKTSLIAATKSLAGMPGRNFLSPEALTTATEAVIAGIAANPEIMGNENEQITWARALFGSFADVVANTGLQATFSSAGLERIAKTTAATLAEHPELIIADRNLSQSVVANILQRTAAVDDFRTESIATAAVDGALGAVVQNPGLLKTRYADVLGDTAKFLAEQVRQNRLSGLQARHLVEAVAKGVAANPELFGQLQDQVAQAVIRKLIEVADGDSKGILAGAALAETGATLISIIAARGQELLAGTSVNALATQVGNVLQIGLSEASAQLGRRVDVPSASLAIRMLLESWARGDMDPQVFEADAMEQFFAELSDFARTRRELPHPA